MQLVRLQLKHSNFYCPVTGQLITGDKVLQASPATLFLCMEDEDGNEMFAPEFEMIREAIERQGDQYDMSSDLLNTLFDSMNDESIVFFVITRGGLERGPEARNTFIAINMNYQPGDEK
jgi:hypothetical protein